MKKTKSVRKWEDFSEQEKAELTALLPICGVLPRNFKLVSNPSLLKKSEIPDISSLSISGENRFETNCSEKSIKQYDILPKEAVTLCGALRHLQLKPAPKPSLLQRLVRFLKLKK
ncbi:hypothetical protein [Endozoicomonas sp.]|uniref:hypothetical protein n=1 Tax=Endozoicomonas sp. TaxID=1892382 RepID=UPI002885464A|nr:hypothetical protein [Endozoicomonas sp.]